MPGFDGTGPRGMGPMTGGGRGFCAIPLWPGYTGMGSHMPYSMSWSTPYDRTPPFTPAVTREEELDYLKGLAQSMREDLQEIEKRVQEMEGKEEKR